MKRFISEDTKDKYFKDQDGNDIVKYNKRTMMHKAKKAFLKGKTHYTYKGETFAVPITMAKQKKE